MCPASSAPRTQFAAKGVDEIVCISVNDPFVMKAWGEATGATAAGITMLADGEGAFTKAIGMDFTRRRRADRAVQALCDAGRGRRGQGAAPGRIPGVCEVSGGEALLAAI
jgi:glutaredoxin/glutathione-dependent peroxiredoxin